MVGLEPGKQCASPHSHSGCLPRVQADCWVGIVLHSECLKQHGKKGIKTRNEKESEDVTKSVGSQESSKRSIISLSISEFRIGMKVIGQLKLGFILAWCNKNHLWILGQHAWMRSTILSSCVRTGSFTNKSLGPSRTKAYQTMPLDLSPAQEAWCRKACRNAPTLTRIWPWCRPFQHYNGHLQSASRQMIVTNNPFASFLTLFIFILATMVTSGRTRK